MARVTGRGLRRWPLSLLLLLAAASGLAASPPRDAAAEALLRKADTADGSIAYVGTKVVHCYATPGSAVSSCEHEVRVWHQPPNATRIEVLPPSDAAGMVTLEVGERKTYYYPWKQRWFSVPLRAFKPSLDILFRNYFVRKVANVTIAGRRTSLIEIRSRRPGYRQKNAWIDRQTGIVLKTELLDAEGRRISSWSYREIAFPGAIAAGLFTTPTAPERPPSPGPSFQRLPKPDFPVVEPRYLPPGFTEVRRSAFRIHGADHLVVRYTDGLNFILFVQQRRDPTAQASPSGRGPRSNASGPVPPDAASARRYRDKRPPGDEGDVATRLTWTEGELRFTLVGGVERPQLERIAASLPPAVTALAPRGVTDGH